jgi:hypothetical protein
LAIAFNDVTLMRWILRQQGVVVKPTCSAISAVVKVPVVLRISFVYFIDINHFLFLIFYINRDYILYWRPQIAEVGILM